MEILSSQTPHRSRDRSDDSRRAGGVAKQRDLAEELSWAHLGKSLTRVADRRQPAIPDDIEIVSGIASAHDRCSLAERDHRELDCKKVELAGADVREQRHLLQKLPFIQ